MAIKIGNLLLGAASICCVGAGFIGITHIMDQDRRQVLASTNTKAMTQPADQLASLLASSSKLETPLVEKTEKTGGMTVLAKNRPVIAAAFSSPSQNQHKRSPETGSPGILQKAEQISRQPKILRAGKESLIRSANKPQDNKIKVAGPPLEDSAEIALINASLTLPETRNIFGTGTSEAGNVTASMLRKAALQPQLLSTGRAFGGFTESEFKKRELRCMATAIYFEARGEPIRGQQAVAQVVMNRVRSPDYPDTICGVIFQGDHRRTGCQFSFACDGKTDRPANASQWRTAQIVAKQITDGQIWMKDIGFCTHYHATYVNPYWKRDMNYVKKIGRHIFYKAKNVSVTETFQRVRG